MASPSFGLPTSGNNAPPPIPGNTNPTGTNNGVGYGGTAFPSYPMYGSPSSGVVSPSANNPVFGTGGSMSGLSTGSPTSTSFGSMLNSIYGSGMASYLDNIFQNGLFNPQVAASFLNAMQPGNAQGLASVQDSFGAEGSRFGSAAALGIGNYESQVNLNEQSTLAGLYENAQSQQLSLLESILPSEQQEKANQGSWVDDLIGGGEIAGGLALTLGTGGIGGLLGGASLIGQGSSTLSKGLAPGVGSSGGGGGSPLIAPTGMSPVGSNNTQYSGLGVNGSITGLENDPAYQELLSSASAGSDLGGSTDYTTDPTLMF
jgi:hypothetical protein